MESKKTNSGVDKIKVHKSGLTNKKVGLTNSKGKRMVVELKKQKINTM